MSRIAAVIPAAGLSSRMGAFKPFLPLGEGTVLSRSIETFQGNGVDHIVVVTGKRGDEVAAAAMKAGAIAVHNKDYEQGMFTSVLAGVKALDDSVSAFFMLPADIPLVRPGTVKQLLSEYRQFHPSVLYPRFLGELGHPPLISRELIPEILRHDGTGGLRRVLERYDGTARELDTVDFGTIHDLDRPEDYELARSIADSPGPVESECRQLWAIYGVSDHIVAHCRAVAKVADALCEHLNEGDREQPLDPVLVRGAALTHDIGKGTKRHEIVGAEMLETYGFDAAAAIVAAHFDLDLGPDAPITEKEVVFLADKLVRCDKPVPLEGRYMEKVAMYRHEEGAEEAILGRLHRARSLLNRFESEMGVSPEDVAREALS